MQTSPMSYGSPSKKNTFYLPRFGFLEYHLSPPMAHLRLQSLSFSLSLFLSQTQTYLPFIATLSLSYKSAISLSLLQTISLFYRRHNPSLSFIFSLSPLSTTNHLSLFSLSFIFSLSSLTYKPSLSYRPLSLFHLTFHFLLYFFVDR